MNQLRDPILRIKHVSFAPNLPWLVLGIILMGVSGWWLADAAVDDPGPLLRLTFSIVASIALVLSLVIREVPRAWFIQRCGDAPQVRQVYPTGSRTDGYYLVGSARAEIRQSIAGPVISLALALVFLLPLSVIQHDSVLGRVLLGVSLLNGLLAGINILPAMPFDGGAAFRAIFWFLHEDHASATRITFVYSQVVASGALGFGLLLLAWRSDLLLPGLWCTLLGWMVVRASRAELMRSHLITRASRVPAADAVAGLNPTIRASDPLPEAVDVLLEQKDNGPGLVRDRDRFVGILTIERLRSVPRQEWNDLLVRDVMSPLDGVTDSPPEADLLEVLRLQSEAGVPAVIVRHPGGEVAGLISRDIAPRLLLRRAENRNVHMAQTGASSGPRAGA